MARLVGSYVVIALLGAVTALVGSVAHRSYPWFGLTLCLLLVAAAAVFARTWRGFGGLTAFAAVWATLTIAFATVGPGGSLLIAGDPLGLAWEFGGGAVIVVVAGVPRVLLMGREERAAA